MPSWLVFALVAIVFALVAAWIVRRLLDHVGHPVRQLTRTQIGPVRLAGLNQGRLRELDETEIGTLLDAAGL